MKALVITPYFPPAEGFGGPTAAIHGQVSMLQSGGFDVHVLTTNADGIKDKCIPKPGWRFFGKTQVYYARCWGFSKPSSFGRFFFAPGLIVQLFKFMPNIDLLQINGIWIFPTLISSRVAFIFGKPYVLNAHGNIFPWALWHKSIKKRMLLALYEKNTLRKACGIQCSSALERRHIEDSFPGFFTFIISNSIDPVPPFAKGRKFREKIGIRETAPLVLFLGRIHVVKGLDLLVDSAVEVIREIPETVFALVGNPEGDYEMQIRKKIAETNLVNKVLLPGPVQGNDKWDALMASDVFAFPSRQENFGMSAAEAMASGVPIVTSDAVGIAEDIAEAGAGLVVERTSESFSRAIITLLRDAGMRRRMGDAGRNLVARKYAPEVVAQSLVKQYVEVIEEHERKPVSRRARLFRSVFGRQRQARS